MELAGTAQDEWCLADALQIVSYTHLAEGDHRLAVPFLEEAFPICDRRGNQFQRGWHHGGMAWVAALQGQMGAAESEIRQAIDMGRTVGDPTLEIWACALLCLILVAAGRPQTMTAEMETLLRVRHEWGGLAEALIPTFAARARLLQDPAGVAAQLEPTAVSLIEQGDLIDGSHLMEQAAQRPSKPACPAEAVRLAALSEEAAPRPAGTALAARMVRGVAARQLGDPAACDLLHDFLGYLADRENLRMGRSARTGSRSPKILILHLPGGRCSCSGRVRRSVHDTADEPRNARPPQLRPGPGCLRRRPPGRLRAYLRHAGGGDNPRERPRSRPVAHRARQGGHGLDAH